MSVSIDWQGSKGLVTVQPRLIAAGLDFGFGSGDPLAFEVAAKVGPIWLVGLREVYAPGLGIVEVVRAVRDAVHALRIVRVWADRENPQMIAHLQSHALPVIPNQIQNVDWGIRTIYGLLKRVVDHPLLGRGPCLRLSRMGCPHLIEEFGRYGYAQVKGEVRGHAPIDRHNHGLDALRYLLTGEGEMPPEETHLPPEEQPTMWADQDGHWHDNPRASMAHARLGHVEPGGWWDEIEGPNEPDLVYIPDD